MTADSSLAAYLLRVSLALAVLLVCAFFIKLKFGKNFNKIYGLSGDPAVEILASLSLGKDVFFVVRCGPDIIAFVSGASGASLMGRWKYDEWANIENKNIKIKDIKNIKNIENLEIENFENNKN